MKTFITIAIVAILSAFAGCSGPDKVGFNTLETARQTAFENATWNAESYRNTSPRMQDLKVIPHGDDTQTPECAWGSGWAKISIMGQKNARILDDKGQPTIEKYVVYCSTVSASRGCFIEKDFQEKPFSKEYGHCADQAAVPFPIPKLAK